MSRAFAYWLGQRLKYLGYESVSILSENIINILALTNAKLLGRYMVKPHEQLVFVSFTRHRASTPNLSTSWSRTAL